MSAIPRRYDIFVGNFGSGKTELALHFASHYRGEGDVTLVDLDIVNPYFRVSERKAELEAEGIRLIAPRFATADVEIITIDPQIYSAFVGDSGYAVFDVGGDNSGARALGVYHDYFAAVGADNLHVWLVVNVRRPLSATPERILRLLELINAASRLPVDGLIHNSNLSRESSGADLLDGYPVMREVARQSGLPVVYTSGEQQALTEFLALAERDRLDRRYIGEPLALETRMHRDWQRFIERGF